MTGRKNKRSYSGHYMAVGNNAQQIVLDWLKKQPWTQYINDHTTNHEMQCLEIDCSFALHDNSVFTVEIKSDVHLGKSGNILFEVVRIYHNTEEHPFGLGWGCKGKADFFAFYAPSVNSIYWCNRIELQQAIKNYVRQHTKDVRYITVPTDADCSTIALLIPFTCCEKVFDIYKLETKEDFLEGIGV